MLQVGSLTCQGVRLPQLTAKVLDCLTLLTSLPARARVSWDQMYPGKDERLLDILGKLLAFNPASRLSVEDALAHPYLETYYDPADEPVAEIPFKFEVEIDDLPTNTLKEMVFQEVLKFKKSSSSRRPEEIVRV